QNASCILTAPARPTRDSPRHLFRGRSCSLRRTRRQRAPLLARQTLAARARRCQAMRVSCCHPIIAAMTTLLAAIVATSRRVTATSARLAKVRELAGCLKSLAPDEIEIGVQYLAGETRQGRFGIGYAALAAANAGGAANEPTLTLTDVDAQLTI